MLEGDHLLGRLARVGELEEVQRRVHSDESDHGSLVTGDMVEVDEQLFREGVQVA